MAENGKRQFVKYNFFKAMPEWRRLPESEREDSKREFAAVVAEWAERMFIRSYSLVGLRADADFLLWQASESLEQLQEMMTSLWRTRLGGFLEHPHSYLAMTHLSQYVGQHRHEGQEGASVRLRPGNHGKYFIVYPFLKTRQWYALPREERQRMMNDHIRIGHKYPSVKINTTYSFGLDDQEFVVAFETSSPSDFLDLVMELRGVEGSLYTLRDTPIFTCIERPLEETLDSLGG
ncbi:MAG: chlorite dismutase family protein [Chloroflexi bacterium]|nr:chlorite dismutase family protein [Chloroflexota bacterium]